MDGPTVGPFTFGALDLSAMPIKASSSSALVSCTRSQAMGEGGELRKHPLSRFQRCGHEGIGRQLKNDRGVFLSPTPLMMDHITNSERTSDRETQLCSIF